MNNCIFCKIINKDIPSVVVFEDDVMMAFLDTSQSTKGHTLLIPTHFENVLILMKILLLIFINNYLKLLRRL